jgi:hypothetical protein
MARAVLILVGEFQSLPNLCAIQTGLARRDSTAVIINSGGK